MRIDQNYVISLFTSAKAIEIADSLNAASDDYWSYKAVRVNHNVYRVDVYDADGIFVESF